MAEALAAIHLCRVRATRLEADGTPMGGSNNYIVSDVPIQLVATPVIQAGEDRTQVGGCDCIISTYRGFDKMKRLDFELDFGKIDPDLFELLTGAALVAGSGGDSEGFWFSDQAFDCSSAVQPNVCLEGWQTGWEDDAQSATKPYLHWIFPSTYWQFAPMTLQNDFNAPKFTGFSRGNPNWGLGPFADLPEAAGSLGGAVWDDSIPAATHGYATVVVT